MDRFLKFKERMDGMFRIVAKTAQVVCACLLLTMIVAVSIQVLGRIFKFKFPVTEEIGTYSLIWMTYIASIAVIIKAEHLTVDLFLSRYKPAQRRFVRIFVNVLILIFCAMLMIFGFQLCRNPIIIKGRTPALQMSRLYVYLSVPIAMTFNTIFVAYDLIVAFADIVFKGGLTEEENRRKALAEAALAEERAGEEAEFRKVFLASGETKKGEEK